MKNRKRFAILLLSLGLLSGLAGCGARNLKEDLLNTYRHWLRFASRHALTPEEELQGEKTAGADAYVGRYTAEYTDFDGEEYLFGGTGLEREAGNELTVTYIMNITSGSAALVWVHSGREYTVGNAQGERTFGVTLGSGDNYFRLEGEAFTGSLELEVK